MRSGATTAYYALGLVIAAGVVVQIFLAGLGIFGAESFEAHKGFGWIIHTAAIVLFLLALLGPRTGRAIGLSFGLLVLMTIQIYVRRARARTRPTSPRCTPCSRCSCSGSRSTSGCRS